MFRQSIDPRGGFPPKGTKKPVKKKKKKGLKKRRSKKQNFDRERKAERAFKFGEVRSGSSGRSVFNPNDFIRFHQSAQFNQQRDSAELSRSGGTFTGTSIGEQRKVLEAQQADVEFKKQQLQVQNRFAGALENFVERIPKPKRERVSTGDFDALLAPPPIPSGSARRPPPIPPARGTERSGELQLEDRTTSGISIDEDIPQSAREPLAPLLQEETRRRAVDPPASSQSYASHRKPEDDLNVVGSSSRGLPRQTSGGSVGSLSRQTSGGSVIEAVTRSRPTPSNPSITDTIVSDHFSERRSAGQVNPVKVPQGLEDKLEFQILPDEAKPVKVQRPAPASRAEPDSDPVEEDIPDLEPSSSASILDYKKGESISERAERLKREFPDEKPKFKVKTSDTAPKVEEEKQETEAQKELREAGELEEKRQKALVEKATARREEKRKQIQEAGKRAGIPVVVTPQPQPEPPPEVEAKGQVEEVDDIGEWLDTLEDSGNTSFHSGKSTNKMTNDTFSFVDTDGIIGNGKFRGKEVVILAINKNKSVLVQLKDTVGTGEKVGDDVRANISYNKFSGNRKNLNLKPFALADEE